MARPKEFSEERNQLTVRIDDALHKAIGFATIHGTKTRAASDGLTLWLAMTYGDKHLKEQLSVALKFGSKKAVELARIVDEQEAAKKGSRSGTAG